ncbi:MAG: DNA-binding response regulator, partial [Sphingomonadaceae bacterium]
MTLRTLIADDEPLAQRRLVIALNKLDDIDLVGTADDG